MKQKDFYNLNRGNNSRKGLIQAEIVKIPSPIRPGVELSFKMRIIKSDDILKTTYKSPYNLRSADHLSIGAVLDILPEIRKDKRNTHPAFGSVDSSGKVEVLAGMRRRKAVSLTENGEFYILVCEELNEQEKAHFALTSDEYEKPSLLDLGFTLIELKQRKAEQGIEINYDELASMYKVSTGKVSEAINFAQLPSELFSLFPSLANISVRFLRSMKKHHKAGEGNFRATLNKAIESGMRVAVSGEDNQDSIKAKCKQLEIDFLESLSHKDSPIKPTSKWSDFNAVSGVKVALAKNGKIKIELDDKKLSKEKLNKIYKLLEST